MAKIADLSSEHPDLANIFGDLSDFDIQAFGHNLDSLFDPKTINSLMSSEFGQGILVGSYLQIAYLELLEQESEVLEEDGV